ncbi:MAG: hypothetical protein ACE5PV_03990 [Candidatus Poribacteria bacterium]
MFNWKGFAINWRKLDTAGPAIKNSDLRIVAFNLIILRQKGASVTNS